MGDAEHRGDVEEVREHTCPFCQSTFEDAPALLEHFCPMRPGH